MEKKELVLELRNLSKSFGEVTANQCVSLSLYGGEILAVLGENGSGKTTLIKQHAARPNYPTFEVTGHGRLEFADLCGHISLQKGSMVYEYGPLPLAMLLYGGILLINEADLLSPEVAVGLNGVLDGAPLCLPENGGEVISPHEMFRITCTANTNGGGDDTGLYQGAVRQNLALLDRYMAYEVGYSNPSSKNGYRNNTRKYISNRKSG